MEIQIPYGRSFITAAIPDHIRVDTIESLPVPAAEQPLQAVRSALSSLSGGISFADFSEVRSVGIAINDKTRPVPHEYLLPPLLDELERLGIPDDGIKFFVAVGTHPPLAPGEFPSILPPEIIERYQVISHDSEDRSGLIFLGQTTRGTEVWSNWDYCQADLKIVVGNLDAHQFAGYSGGVKSAAIGLSGFETITQNHTLMAHPDAQKGEYLKNPVRQDIEEIGQMMGIDLALNAILNQDKELARVLAGTPLSVLEAGIPIIKDISQIPVSRTYDLVISSPGGYPKDIDVYQAQKALSSAVRITRQGGTVIIVAACPEGSGNSHYENWIMGKGSFAEVRAQFKAEGFRIGPHKAYMFARDAENIQLKFFSDMETSLASKLLLNPIEDFQAAIDDSLAGLGPAPRVALIPQAASMIPYLIK